MKTKIVVMGGGTGTFVVLSAVKQFSNAKITAVVSSADSGGSTGILRDEFGILPVGDFRQCLVALAKDADEKNLLRELFNYRFSRGGEGLEGHSFGNLFLTALTDILGSNEKAIRKASKILNIQGRVFPVTYDDIHLIAQYEDGSILFGEAMIDEPPSTHDGKLKITKLWVQPTGKVSKKAEEALREADYIVLGPGDLYTSTLAAIVVDDVAKILQKSKAKIIYITNLVSKYGQTHGFKTSDYVSELKKYIKREIDYVMVNTKMPPQKVLKKYHLEKSYFVEDDLPANKNYTKTNLTSSTTHSRIKHDKIKRSLLRHDIEKLRLNLEKIVFS